VVIMLMAVTPKLKQKRCANKSCRMRFSPSKPLQSVCCWQCAQAVAEEKKRKDSEKKARDERRKDRAAREALKTRSQWMKDAQVEFNAYIRARDFGQRCISCGVMETATVLRGHKMDAGHYRSVGSAPHLRFDQRNCHAQCVQCNRYGSGRAVDYRIGLVRRIGVAAVEALESDNTVRKWTIEELKALKLEFRAKRKELEAKR